MSEQDPVGADSVGAAPKKKWGKGKIAGVAGGGCCGVLLLLFVIGLIGAGVSGQLGAAPTTEAATTTEALSTTEPASAPSSTATPPSTTETPTSVAAPKTQPPTTTAAPTTPSPTSAEPKEDPQAWADGVANDVIVANAGEGGTWADTCGTGWCSYVTGVSATATGQLHVRLQVEPGGANNDQLARNTASFIILSASESHPELKWVVVEDATGTVIEQYQSSDFGR